MLSTRVMVMWLRVVSARAPIICTLDGDGLESGARVRRDGISAEAVAIDLPQRAIVVLQPGDTYVPDTARVERIEVRRQDQ